MTRLPELAADYLADRIEDACTWCGLPSGPVLGLLALGILALLAVFVSLVLAVLGA